LAPETRRLHPEKKGIRVLGIAESSRKFHKKSALAGVVMRRDLVIDGMVLDSATMEGDDATEKILSMYKSLARDDIVCIMTSGLVISMYNIIDGQRVSDESGLPVIAVTFNKSSGLQEIIKNRFPNSSEKMATYSKLGSREAITLRTGKTLFIRCWGITPRKATSILNSFTLQGSLPEPIRVAKLAARSFSSAML
jgi:endonuclease V-like protein UPF0215 family